MPVRIQKIVAFRSYIRPRGEIASLAVAVVSSAVRAQLGRNTQC
jgi:hypothetical protein